MRVRRLGGIAVGTIIVVATVAGLAIAGPQRQGSPWTSLTGDNQFNGNNECSGKTHFNHSDPLGLTAISKATGHDGSFSHTFTAEYDNPSALGDGVVGITRGLVGHGVDGVDQSVGGGVGVFGSTESKNGHGVVGGYNHPGPAERR